MRPKIFVVLSVFVGLIIGGFVVARYFDIGLSRFWAAENIQPGFVYVQGNKLMLDGQEYFAKGMNLFFPFKYAQSKFLNTGIPGLELYEVQGFWNNFDAQKISDEFRYYHEVLGINAVRLFTPSLQYFDANVQYHGWPPWFLADGSINPVYRDRVVQLIDIAKQNGVRVSLELFHNAPAIDWECRATSGVWSDCTMDYLTTSVTSAANARIVEPGTVKEARYLKYLQSLIPYLKDSSGIFAYEVSNESLLNWPFNGRGVSPRRDWYQDKVGSFLLRMAREIRRLDPNHPITEGEVTEHGVSQPGWWAWPSPEFGALNDIHNLNGGQPYTLESFLDFLSPHFYLQDPAFPGPALTEIRSRTTKPIVLGEFGYFLTNADTLAAPSSNANRLNYIRSIVALPRNPGISGYFPWAPLVPLNLVSGYSIVPLSTPWGDRGIRFPGSPERTVVGASFEFTLFTYDTTYPYNQKPLPEAVIYFGDIQPMVNGVAFVSQSVPMTMTLGQTAQVSITFRNSGTKTWDKIGSPGDYNYAYRIKSQNPTDNTVWGINFVPIPRTPIAPGENATFNFTIRAPTTPGTYNFQWQLNQGLVGWFGDPTPNIAIQVTAGTSPTPTPTISATPTISPTPTPGSLPTFLIDGSLISTRRQLEAFSFTGSGFTPNGSVERWVRTAGTNNNVRLSPNYAVSSQGTVAWSYTAACSTAPSTSILWLIDVATGRKSAEVAEIVNQHPNCVQATQTPTPTGSITPSQYGLREGDLVSAANSADPDIYIINQNGYKRLFLNPVIFSFYGHLGGFQNVKTVSSNTRDVFKTSLYFKNCETNDPKVYAVQVTGEDTGVLHWLNLSQELALQQDPFFNQKVFCINNNEYAWYPKGSEYTSLTQVPEYRR